MVENFDLPEKLFATATRAKKPASALPKINSVSGPSAGTPPVRIGMEMGEKHRLGVNVQARAAYPF